jgi:hypothetical protein
MKKQTNEKTEDLAKTVKLSTVDIHAELDKAFSELFTRLDKCRIRIELDSQSEH